MAQKIPLQECGLVVCCPRGGKGSRVGGTAMETKVGDTVRSVLNGIEYRVKRIVKRMAVLESQDGKSQILTDLENLNLFYKKEKGKAV